MSFNLTIPTEAAPIQISLKEGERLFVLGANGSGKSSLIQKIFSEHKYNAHWISAHRQTWFNTDTVNFTPAQKKQVLNNILSQDNSPTARYLDHNPLGRINIAIYDLVNSENRRARSISKAFEESLMDEAMEISQKAGPILTINKILRESNLSLEIMIRNEDESIYAKKDGKFEYGISKLSDGERNALLIAATILTVSPGTLLLIDEPERHLHRSISSPLLTSLFVERSDCAFIISTHEPMLVIDSFPAKTLLIRGCSYNNSGNIVSWMADLLSSEEEIPEELKRDILGSRRKILFVEGIGTSLDKPLYSILFPEVSVLPKSNSRDVTLAVKSIRSMHNLHWVKAFGIIDNDGRNLSEIPTLKANGIHPLEFYSVESIYYHPEIQRRIAIRFSEVTGIDPKELITSLETKILSSLGSDDIIDHLCARRAEKSIQNEFFKKAPNQDQILHRNPINVSINISEFLDAEIIIFKKAIINKDLHKIITRYPIRESKIPSMIAKSILGKSREDYEAAVRKLLVDDSEALQFVKDLFKELVHQIVSE